MLKDHLNTSQTTNHTNTHLISVVALNPTLSEFAIRMYYSAGKRDDVHECWPDL